MGLALGVFYCSVVSGLILVDPHAPVCDISSDVPYLCPSIAILMYQTGGSGSAATTLSPLFGILPLHI